MLKNILAKFGSKKIAGAVLVMATLLVGIGVISNFSDDQKIANDAALSRFNDNAFNNFGSGVSRSALERQMSAQQDRNTARFLQGKNTQDGMDEEDAFSSDGAYAEGVNGDEGFVYGEGGAYGVGGVYGEGGAYDPSNPMYVANAYDADGNPIMGGYGADGSSMSGRAGQGGAYGVGAGAGEDGSEEGEAGGKGAKGKNKAGKGGKKVKNTKQTQLNRLAVGNNSGSMKNSGGGSAAGGAANFSGAMSGGDISARPLPQNEVQISNTDLSMKAFRHGRGGAMGGRNVSRTGAAAADNGKGGGNRGGATADLQLASAYSGKAVASKVETSAKMLAQAAFDGSNPDDIGTTIEAGATIKSVANELLTGNTTNNNLPPALKDAFKDIDDTMTEIEEQQRKLDQLDKDLNKRIEDMIKYTLIMAVALFFTVKAAYAAPAAWWLWVAGGVISVGAEALMYGMMYGYGDHSKSILGIISQMKDLTLVNEGIDFDHKVSNAWWTYGVLQAVLGLCWLPWSNIFGGGGAATGGSGGNFAFKNPWIKNPWKGTGLQFIPKI